MVEKDHRGTQGLEPRSSLFNRTKCGHLARGIPTCLHPFIGRSQLTEQIQSPPVQRADLLSAREQSMPNDVHGTCEPDLRLLFCRVSVERLRLGQGSLPLPSYSR